MSAPTKPWYPRDPQAFVLGTMGMSLELRGAYSVLLDLMYHRGGYVPDDEAELARIMGVNRQRWRRVRGELIGLGKVIEWRGHLTNERVLSTLRDSPHLTLKQPKTSPKVAENLPETSKFSRTFPEVSDPKSSENNDVGGGIYNIYIREPPPCPPPLAKEPVAKAPPARKPKREIGHRLPDDFVVPDAWKDAAREAIRRHKLPDINLDLLAEEFVLYWTGRSRDAAKRDWKRAFINRALNVAQSRVKQQSNLNFDRF